MTNIKELTSQVEAATKPLERPSDLDPLLERIGDAQIVAIGEASHGNHEYHDLRAMLTRRLIADSGGFSFVAVEADQPDCELVDRSVRHMVGAPADPSVVLYEQQHWPSWMWVNTETVDFSRWLSDYNSNLPVEQQVSWQGLDRYPLWGATRSVLDYVRSKDPNQVNEALDAPLRGESMVPEQDINTVARHLATTLAPESITDAEGRYQAMLRGGVEGMNSRSTHWLDTIDHLINQRGEKSRAVIWAHNTHVGDTRGTSMAVEDIVSIGELLREQYGSSNVALIGFAGGDGTVMAAHERGAAMDTIPVPKPRSGSVEAVLYEAKPHDQSLFVFPKHRTGWLTTELDHRAIGAVYDTSRDTEFYVPTRLGLRYDALCWYPQISSVRALHFDEARQGKLETLRDAPQGHNVLFERKKGKT